MNFIDPDGEIHDIKYLENTYSTHTNLEPGQQGGMSHLFL